MKFGILAKEHDNGVTNFAISQITRILQYQINNELRCWASVDAEEIGVSLVCAGFEKERARTWGNKPPRFVMGRIEEKFCEPAGRSIWISRPFDTAYFSDLSSAELEVRDGVPFAVPVFDLSLLPRGRLEAIRLKLLEEFEAGLAQIGMKYGLDQTTLSEAFKIVRAQPLEITRVIGETINQDGEDAPSAQLVARWTPDYLYHYARISRKDRTDNDILFMIYWRDLTPNFFENPGILTWMDDHALLFTPHSRGGLKLGLAIDGPPVDFSCFNDPPRLRTFQFIPWPMREKIKKGGVVPLNY